MGTRGIIEFKGRSGTIDVTVFHDAHTDTIRRDMDRLVRDGYGRKWVSGPSAYQMADAFCQEADTSAEYGVKLTPVFVDHVITVRPVTDGRSVRFSVRYNAERERHYEKLAKKEG